MPSRERLVGHHADGVQVAANIGILAFPDLWGCVPRRAGLRGLIGGGILHSDVRNLHDATFTKKNIPRLEVSMNLSVTMEVSEPAQESREDPADFVRRLRRAHFLAPIIAVNQLHRVIGLA